MPSYERNIIQASFEITHLKKYSPTQDCKLDVAALQLAEALIRHFR
jgi:hypothetical protein